MGNLNVKYKIIKKDEINGYIVVRFYTNRLTEEMISSSYNEDGTAVRDENNNIVSCKTDFAVYVQEIPFPSEIELEDIIMETCPLRWLERYEKIKCDNITPDFSSINDKMHKEKSKTLPVPPRKKQV